MHKVEFSAATATSLKRKLHQIARLSWTNENILDLTRIKQLKGCRTRLVWDSLEFIHNLDKFVANNPNSNEKQHAANSTTKLIDGLQKYINSCERYPRIKDFLNIIPDNNGIGMFTALFITSLTAAAFAPLAIIPLAIIFWALMDLFFNNRWRANNLKNILSAAKDELVTITSARSILNGTNNFAAENLSSESSLVKVINSANNLSPKSGSKPPAYSSLLFAKAVNTADENTTENLATTSLTR